VRVERRKDAILITDQGKITFSLNYDQAPRNVENFLELVRSGFYDGKTFHRIVPGFLLQGGSPTGDSTGVRPDGRLIPAEFTNAPVEQGALMMARKPADPDSASCQFLIALDRLPDLDGKYTIIGHARDAESARTFQTLSAIPTNKQDRPLQSVIIRSIKLLDAQPPQPTTRSAHGP
jgi:cyclophilin family peptidyl-prolyl cis-trans isomerase